MSYRLLDSGNGEKLEQFGPYVLARPSALAVWKKQRPELWQEADGLFSREEKKGWSWKRGAPKPWEVEIGKVRFRLMPTDFGHLGVFPEHAAIWEEVRSALSRNPSKDRPRQALLNLFAYSGGVSLAAAQAGAEVCHVDAAKGMIEWARENAALNQLEEAPIRWIVDDALKFMRREIKRGRRYDAIVLDPPTFGRGSKGEVFKIEEEIGPLLAACRELLVADGADRFVVLTCHTPGFTPLVLSQLLQEAFPRAEISAGEMTLQGSAPFAIPSGAFAKAITRQ
jgi:23S rRNA (cytosine1962-C5)-methyltransferase